MGLMEGVPLDTDGRRRRQHHPRRRRRRKPHFPSPPFLGRRLKGLGSSRQERRKKMTRGGARRRSRRCRRGLRPKIFLDNGEKEHALFSFLSLAPSLLSTHSFRLAAAMRVGKKISSSGKGHTNMAFFSSPLFADL